MPISEAGIDPASGCGKPLFGDRYNASTCPGIVYIPNPFTGHSYDSIGAYTQPNELIANLQLSYDVSPRIQLVGILTNIVNYCWGGSQTPWTFKTATSAGTGTSSERSIRWLHTERRERPSIRRARRDR